MASAQKRVWKSGKTTWIARWYLPDGSEHSQGGFSSKKAANAHATDREKDAARGLTFDPAAGKTTFRDAAATWLAGRADLKPRTRHEYGQMLAPAAERRGDMKKLGIDAVFGGYPVNKITRTKVVDWIADLTEAKKRPSTVRHNYFLLRQVLQHAVDEGWIATNHAAHVRLPSDHGKPGVVDDPAQFLTAEQVFALADTTPWPYSVMVHVAGWAGLRAGELAGLQIGDVDLSPARGSSGLDVRRAVVRGGTDPYGPLKTAASRRRVPIDDDTAELLTDYIDEHPRRDDPAAPLFPAFKLTPADGPRAQRPRGSEAEHWRKVADRQAATLAALSVAEATDRLALDWTAPLRHLAFYKAVFRPAVLRAIRLDPHVGIARTTRFHALRHSWVSIAASAGIAPEKISRMAGHTRVSTTLDIYTHVFPDDHAAAMDALGAVARRARRKADSSQKRPLRVAK